LELIEWAINYVKNKDLVKRDLVDYEQDNEIIIFHHKEYDQTCFCVEYLDDSIKKQMDKKKRMLIVCPNSKKNLKYLTENWKFFKDYEFLSLVFANIEYNLRWIIRPSIHNHVADESNIAKGLKAMFETVPSV